MTINVNDSRMIRAQELENSRMNHPTFVSTLQQIEKDLDELHFTWTENDLCSPFTGSRR